MTSIIGQQHITSVITGIDNIDAPVLFLGQEGIGKRTFVEELIASVHPTNVRRFVDPSIDNVRSLIDWANRRAFNSFKVIFIEFTKFSAPAQNALLKLLEEPPSSVKIILIGRPDSFLATIRSRCLIYNFYPLSRQDVTSVLCHSGYDLDTAHIAAEYSEGSVKKALSYLDAEEAISGARALLEGRPSECVGSLIKFKSESQLSIFVEQTVMAGWRPSTFVILSKDAGIRGKVFLSMMMGGK